MKTWLSSRPLGSADLYFILFRLTIAVLMLMHGIPKLGKFSEPELHFADPIGLGEGTSLVLTVFAEVLCSVTLAIGLWTRLSVIPLAITMLVAAFIVHADDPFGKQEFPLLYVLCYLSIFFSGPWKYSLDAWIESRRKA